MKHAPVTLPALLLTAVAATAVLTTASPAHAMTGREAVDACYANPACDFNVLSDGAVWIFINGKRIYCDSAKAQCIPVSRGTDPTKKPKTRAETGGREDTGMSSNDE